MDSLIRRLEALHHALRAAPDAADCDPRIVEAVAHCLRELHAIAAEPADGTSRGPDTAAPRLRYIH